MSQDKLEVVKQNMARVNINILGISELTWVGMGKFNSDEHYIYYCGQGSLRTNGVTLIVNKMQYLGATTKTTEWSVHFQSKPFKITLIQVCAPTTNAKEYEDKLLDHLELTLKRDVLFKIGNWNAKVGSQEIHGITGRQLWPWSTKWSRAKTIRVLPIKCTGHRKYPLPTTQDITLHMYITEIRLIIFFAAKDGEALYCQQNQDWELTVVQIINSLLQNSDLNWRK